MLTCPQIFWIYNGRSLQRLYCNWQNGTALEKVKEKMKKKAQEETTPIPKIYHEVLQEVAQSESHEAIALILPTYGSMKLSLYRKRHEKFSPLPQSVEVLNFEGKWSKTHNGDNFMLCSCDGVFMFSTNANIALIAETSTLYMNGTFQICPRLFYQLHVAQGGCAKHRS